MNGIKINFYNLTGGDRELFLSLLDKDDCFYYKEDAEDAEEAIRREKLAEWKRLSILAGEGDNPWDGHNHHWYCYFSVLTGTVEIASYWSCRTSDVCFPTAASLKAAIDEMGEDNIKKYILGVDKHESTFS